MKRIEGYINQVSDGTSISEKRQHLYALGFFALLAVGFFHEALSGALLVAGDAYAQNYPLRAFYASALKAGELPLWNPYEGIGLPFIGELQAGVLYPPNLIAYLALPAQVAFNSLLIFDFALAGFFAYLYLRQCGLRGLASTFGGVVFAYLGFMSLHKVHTPMMDAAIWLPMMLYLMQRMRVSLSVADAAWLGLVVGVQMLAGHTQTCVYSWMTLGLYAAVHVWDMPRRARFLLLLFGALAAGAIVSLPQIAATSELDRLSWRSGAMDNIGYLFFKEFHVYLNTLPSLIFPHIFSGAYGERPDGTASDAVIAFIGTAPLVLAFVAAGAAFKRDRSVRFWALLAAMAFVLALGDSTPLGGMMFHVPVYNLFRSHSRNLFEFSLAVAGLSAWAVEHIGVKRSRALWGMAGLLVLALAAAAHYARVASPMAYAPELALIALGIAALALLKNPRHAAMALIIIVAVEGYYYGRPLEYAPRSQAHMNAVCAESGFPMDGVAPPRFLSPPQSASGLLNLLCGADCMNAYSMIAPKAYLDLMDIMPQGFVPYWDHLVANNTLLSMLGVRYLQLPHDASLEGLAVKQRATTLQAVIAAPEPHVISAPGREGNNILPLSVDVEAGDYVLELEARALKPGASLRVEAYAERQRAQRFTLTPLKVYPGALGAEFQPLHRMFHADADTRLNIALISVTNLPVEVRNIRLRRISDMGPQPMGAPSGPAYRVLKSTPGYALVENLNALPRAYAVTEIKAVKDFAALSYALDLGLLNPAREAVVIEGDEPPPTTAYNPGEVELVSYSPRRIALKARFERGAGFVVLSDLYYRGWRVTVDGEPSRVYRVDGALRGVEVPAGAHEIVFEFRPRMWHIWGALAFALGLVAAGARGFASRRCRALER